MIFVNQGFSTQKKKRLVKTVVRQAAKTTSRSSASGSPSSEPNNSRDSKSQPDGDSDNVLALIPFSHSPIISALSPLQIFSTPTLAPVFQSQFFSLFCDVWLPFPSAGPTFTWLLTLPHLRLDDPALEAACAALCMARLGQVNGDVRLEKESMKLYGQGLKKLQQALYDPERMYSDETLASAKVLALYEVVLPLAW
jgi:hypothetical protein